MESTDLNCNESVEREGELEPVVLSRVTEVTRGAFGAFNMDGDNIVWGMFIN
ncbi:MAG TPA: hypothetical protein VF075_00430 [Pyrinomonadaceae bacterium]